METIYSLVVDHVSISTFHWRHIFWWGQNKKVMVVAGIEPATNARRSWAEHSQKLNARHQYLLWLQSTLMRKVHLYWPVSIGGDLLEKEMNWGLNDIRQNCPIRDFDNYGRTRPEKLLLVWREESLHRAMSHCSMCVQRESHYRLQVFERRLQRTKTSTWD